MRLIDADTCIESIKNLMANGATLEQAIDAQPTEYNVEGVLATLGDKRNHSCNQGIQLFQKL